MGRLKKTHTVAFRVDEDKFRRINEAAGAEALGANEWCRELVLARVGGAHALGAGERLLYEEVACLRYLLSHGLKLLATGHLSAEAWDEVLARRPQLRAHRRSALSEARRRRQVRMKFF